MSFSQVEWEAFSQKCVEAMEKFDADEIDMGGAFDILSTKDNIDDDYLGFVEYIISEIGGNYDEYLDVLNLFKNKITPEELRERYSRLFK